MVLGKNTLLGKLWLVLLISAMALPLAAFSATAADYPDKPIEMVAWASAGGGSDLMCRTFAKAAEGVFPQPIYVVNKPGGGGAVGMAYVQGKPADGYTLLGVTNNLVFTPLTKPDLNYDAKDFTPIIMWGFDAKCVAVSADGPYKTIEDFVKAAKENPGKIKIGTFGLGTDDHIVGILLGKAAGVEFGYVPFDSGGEQTAALLGGHIAAQITEVNEVSAQVEAGKIRIIAVATDKRLEGLPDVPTMTEKGWDVVVPKFRGLMVKKGTPEPIVQYLITHSLETVKTPIFKDYLKKNLIEPSYATGEEFGNIVMKQQEQFGAILKELGF